MMQGNERPFSAILREVVADFQEIVRSEVRLAKTEIKDEAVKASQAAKITAIGGVLGLYAGGVLLLAVIWLLALAVTPWVSALIVGIVLAFAAVLFLAAGRKRFKSVSPTPDRTIESIKENLQWNKSPSR